MSVERLRGPAPCDSSTPSSLAEFSGVDVAASLAAIRILALPASGSLALNGLAVLPGAGDRRWPDAGSCSSSRCI